MTTQKHWDYNDISYIDLLKVTREINPPNVTKSAKKSVYREALLKKVIC